MDFLYYNIERNNSNSNVCMRFLVRNILLVLSVGVVIAFIIKGVAGGIHVEWTGDIFRLSVALLLVYSFEYILKRVGIYRHYPVRTSVLFLKFLLIGTLISAVCTIATYSAAWGNPHFRYTHDYFVHLDRMLFGFNWVSFDLWLMEHKTLSLLVQIAYSMITILYMLTIGFLVAEERIDAVYRFFAFQVVTFAITVVVFYFFPAIGPAVTMQHTTSSLIYTHSYFAALHKTGVFTLGVNSLDGLNKIADKSGAYYMTGIISFPSYHAVCVVAYIYFSKYFKKAAAAIFRVLSVFMLFSTIPVGNHCVVDVLGGIVVALAGIYLTCGGPPESSLV